MPQHLTFDPLKLKTGDKVFAAITSDNNSNLKPSFKTMRFTVIEKHEFIHKIDYERSKRSFRFKLHSELEMRPPKNAADNVREIEVDDTAPLFLDMSDLIDHMIKRMKGWLKILDEHDGRQTTLDGILYQVDPVGK